MGREEVFIDLGGGAPKTSIFNAKLTFKFEFPLSSPLATRAMMDGLRTLDP